MCTAWLQSACDLCNYIIVGNNTMKIHMQDMHCNWITLDFKDKTIDLLVWAVCVCCPWLLLYHKDPLYLVLQCVHLVLLKSIDFFLSWNWCCRSFNYIQNLTYVRSFCPMWETVLNSNYKKRIFGSPWRPQNWKKVKNWLENDDFLPAKRFRLSFPEINSNWAEILHGAAQYL